MMIPFSLPLRPRPQVTLAAVLLLSALLPALLTAQEVSAIFHHSDTEVRQVDETGWEAFRAAHARLNGEGYRLTDLETYREGAEDRRYLGVYTKSPLADHVERRSSWSEFIKLKREMAKKEFTMIDVAAVVNNESDYDFYGVWVKEDNPTIHKVWFLDSRKTMLDRTRAMAKDRFKIKRIHVLNVPTGEPAFVVLYHFSPVNRYNFIFFADTPEQFAAEVAERVRSKVQIIDYARFRYGDRDQYVGIFQDGDYDAEFLTPTALETLAAQADSLAGTRGLRLVNLSVY